LSHSNRRDTGREEGPNQNGTQRAQSVHGGSIQRIRKPWTWGRLEGLLRLVAEATGVS
jgi:hypothetical protein